MWTGKLLPTFRRGLVLASSVTDRPRRVSALALK